jgi:hypothetical protein
MKITPILCCAVFAGAALAGFPPRSVLAGTIQGTVVNTSSGAPKPCQVAVVLQVQVKGQFVPLRDVVSDEKGRFCFQRLPVGDGIIYQSGATRHGVFYPGPRIRLTEVQPNASTELSVCDAVAGPNPLVLKKMDITIRPETGLLKVTESLLVENPSHTCYVGNTAHEGADPVTLELSIPPDFQRTTFDLEFFGRRFALVNNKLVTGIPWPPGERELRYTYVLRNTEEVSLWKRSLDLPCSNVTIHVEGKSAGEVRCESLGRTKADEKSVVFESAGQEISAGQVLQVELGRLPLPWMTYGKWAAVAVMLLSIAAGGWYHLRRGTRQSPAEPASKTLIARNEKKRAA